MNQDEKELKLWKYLAATVVCVVTLITGGCKVTQYNIVRLSEAGYSPIQARCALETENHTELLCYKSLEADAK